jgi:hypothetical protein
MSCFDKNLMNDADVKGNRKMPVIELEATNGATIVVEHLKGGKQ